MLIYWSMLYHLPTEYIEYWILQIQYNNYLQIYNRGSYKTWHLERFFTFECKGESLKQNSGELRKTFITLLNITKCFFFFKPSLTEAVLLAPPSMIWSWITTYVRQVASLTRGGMMNSRTEERGEVWSAGGSSVLWRLSPCHQSPTPCLCCFCGPWWGGWLGWKGGEAGG